MLTAERGPGPLLGPSSLFSQAAVFLMYTQEDRPKTAKCGFLSLSTNHKHSKVSKYYRVSGVYHTSAVLQTIQRGIPPLYLEVFPPAPHPNPSPPLRSPLLYAPPTLAVFPVIHLLIHLWPFIEYLLSAKPCPGYEAHTRYEPP